MSFGKGSSHPSCANLSSKLVTSSFGGLRLAKTRSRRATSLMTNRHVMSVDLFFFEWVVGGLDARVFLKEAGLHTHKPPIQMHHGRGTPASEADYEPRIQVHPLLRVWFGVQPALGCYIKLNSRNPPVAKQTFVSTVRAHSSTTRATQ